MRKVIDYVQEFINRIKADYSSETMEARSQWDEVFKLLKGEVK